MGQALEFELALSVLQQKVETSDLLTRTYARYLPLLADGLRYFLERLPPERLRRIFEEQLRLASDASTAERVSALVVHVPVLHKLGQVVSRDHRLDPSFRKRLQPLESLPPRLCSATIQTMLSAVLPDWEAQGITLGDKPLAEGSVAVVVPFSWKHGSSNRHPMSEGVFKLLKPRVKETLNEDLTVLGSLGGFLDQECTRYHLPQLDYRETFSSIRDLLIREVQLDQEQANLRQAAGMYESNPKVLIPALFPFCSPNLTAMERVNGTKLHEGPMVNRESLARVVAEALIAQPMFSAVGEALFHADPHAGNLMVTTEGRLAILDWSLTGHLRREDREQLVQLALAAMMLDESWMVEIVGTLAGQQADRPAVRRVVARSLRALRWGERPGVSWLTRLLDSLVFQANVRFSSDLLLFRKSLLTLEGVMADLAPGKGIRGPVLDEAMVGMLARHWLEEWPTHLKAPASYRSRTTHLSLADVVGVLWATPLTTVKWWTANGAEMLGVIRSLSR